MTESDCLAATGISTPWVLVSVAVLALVAGAIVLFSGRRRRALPILAAVPLLLGVLVIAQVPAPAYAAAEDAVACDSPTDEGMIPTASPAPTPASTPSPTPSPTETPSTCPPVAVVSDKSETIDTDLDGIVNACDLDSDNDGILDTEEDLNSNGLYEDDDVDGDLLVLPTLGDGLSSYIDLDSDNDGVLDLMEGRPFTNAQVDAFDGDHNGIIDSSFAFGANGLLDDLETVPDSGVLRPEFLPQRNTDGDDKQDFVDVNSNGADFDLYLIGRDSFDQLGLGFISPVTDADVDGIMDQVDTDTSSRGAPGSPYAPM